jgi:hypothetical protein
MNKHEINLNDKNEVRIIQMPSKIEDLEEKKVRERC